MSTLFNLAPEAPGADRVEMHLQNYIELVDQSSTLETKVYAVRELLFSMAAKHGKADSDGRYRILQGETFDVLVNTKSTNHAIFLRKHGEDPAAAEKQERWSVDPLSFLLGAVFVAAAVSLMVCVNAKRNRESAAALLKQMVEIQRLSQLLVKLTSAPQQPGTVTVQAEFETRSKGVVLQPPDTKEN